VDPKAEPVIVTCVPAVPEVGETALRTGGADSAGAGCTVTEVVIWTLPKLAEIVAVPGLAPNATPGRPVLALLIKRVEIFDVLHVT